MQYDLQQHPLFKSRQDPDSGVVSYLLKNEIAPLQRHFYYTNPSLRAEDEWLWFVCAWPPNPQKTLGVVSLDPKNPAIRHFPHAGYSQASPMVTEDGSSVYFCAGAVVWQMDLDGELTRIGELPADYIDGRYLFRLATHLTLSADQRYLLLDGCVGLEYFVALMEVKTGEVKVIREFEGRHDHGQFSPVNPQLYLLARDQTTNPVTGRFIHHAHRIHVLDIHDTRYECLTPKQYCKPYVGDCHEWWTSDGQIGYINYERGMYLMDEGTGEAELIWPEPLCHGHSHPDGRYFVADQDPYQWAAQPCQVKIMDRSSGNILNIDHGMPQPPALDRAYHVHPHPQFSSSGDWVVYTSTHDNQTRVALCDMTHLKGQLDEASRHA